jgi:hypothetical protein
MEETETTTAKKPYVTPHIIVLGDIQAITLGTANGNFTDQAFPMNTNRLDLTFS